MTIEIPLLDRINQYIVNPAIGGLIAMALVVFLWGMVELFLAKDNAERVQRGKAHMLWGIIGLAIMVSVFGIMRVICNTVGCA